MLEIQTISVCFSDSEVSELRQKTLSILTASGLLTSDTSCATLVPGSTQCLLSLARVALSASVEIPELWGAPQSTPQLLQCLLQCPHYEVRELTVEVLLNRLNTEQEAKGRPQWLDETVLLNLTSLALHKTHPQCLAKVGPLTYHHSLSSHQKNIFSHLPHFHGAIAMFSANW